MARKKQTAKEQAQGLGCLVLIGLAVVVYASSNRGGNTSTPSPTPNAPNYGQAIDARDEWTQIPEGVQFKRCPLVDCAVLATAGDNDKAFIIRMEAGEIVDGIELWVVADIDGTEGFAPAVYVFPRPTPTPEATNEK
jgi:hypothetical protein